MDRNWELIQIKENYIMKPKNDKICPFCGTKMLLHGSKAAYYKQKDFYHNDINFKCPKCNFWAVFGVAISKDEFVLLENSKYNNSILLEELNELTDEFNLSEEDIKIIEHRLKTLGYY